LPFWLNSGKFAQGEMRGGMENPGADINLTPNTPSQSPVHVVVIQNLHFPHEQGLSETFS